MTFQIIVDLIDTISPLVTMGFGIFGATRDTKPKEGKLTKDGKIALWGIVLSACFTLLVKSGNLYFKNKASQEQAVKMQTEENKKQNFQAEVAASFERSISKLEKINHSVDTAVSEVKEVNSSTAKNIALTNQISVNASKVLLNTNKVLRPLFPLEIGFVYEIKAPDLNLFWKFVEKNGSKLIRIPNLPFETFLPSDLLISFVELKDSLIPETRDILFPTSVLTFYKKESMSRMTLAIQTDGSDFEKVGIYVNIEKKIILVFCEESIDNIIDGIPYEWSGVNDLANSLLKIEIFGRGDQSFLPIWRRHVVNYQVVAFSIYRGTDDFMHQEYVKECDYLNVPWKQAYTNPIKEPKSNKESQCLMKLRILGRIKDSYRKFNEAHQNSNE